MNGNEASKRIPFGIGDWSMGTTAVMVVSCVILLLSPAFFVWLRRLSREAPFLTAVFLVFAGCSGYIATQNLQRGSFLRGAAKVVAVVCLVPVGAAMVSLSGPDGEYSFTRSVNAFVRRPWLSVPLGLSAFAFGYFIARRSVAARLSSAESEFDRDRRRLVAEVSDLKRGRNDELDDLRRRLWKRERKIAQQGDVISELRRQLRPTDPRDPREPETSEEETN